MKNEFKNESDHTFIDISSEEWREYTFDTQFSLITIRISNPLRLAVSKSGGHRIFDADGLSHYIPSGWVHLMWKVKDGQPHFVK